MLDADLLRAVAHMIPGERGARQRAIIDKVGEALDRTLRAPQYRIDTPLRIAHFLAQTAHESDGFSTTEEYASGDAYEGRHDLGNDEPGDGRRYKGRGLIQLTGRDNYLRYGRMLGIPLLTDPELAPHPETSLLIACEYWRHRRINEHADHDDLRTVTHLVNGGQNGYQARREYLARAKAAVGCPDDSAPPRPEVWCGITSEHVRALQVRIRVSGRNAGAIDGSFGHATESAVREFQESQGLPATGRAGRDTWLALPL